MHHPQSLDPLSVTALGSGLRTTTTDRDDDSSPADDVHSTSSVDDGSRVRRRATLLSRVPELHPQEEPVASSPSFRVIDVPTFFFFPFDHVAHQVAAEVHGLGAMRRVAVHTTGTACGITARALVLSMSRVGSHAGALAEVLVERESRFSDLEALIVAIDAAIEWLGLDVRPPVELTLDIDFERDGEVDPNDVTLTVRTSRTRSGEGIVAEVMLFHELTAEALVLQTRFADAKDLPVYPAPRKLPPPSDHVLAVAAEAPTAERPAV